MDGRSVPGASKETDNEQDYDIAEHTEDDQMVKANWTCGVHVLSGERTALARNGGGRMVPPLTCLGSDAMDLLAVSLIPR